MQLTGQLTPLETRKVHPEGKAEQAAFVFLLEPQQSAPLSAKLLSCGVSNRGLRKTAAEASVFMHKSRIRWSPGWPSRVSRPGKSLEVWMITLPEEGFPSAWLNEAEWPALLQTLLQNELSGLTKNKESFSVVNWVLSGTVYINTYFIEEISQKQWTWRTQSHSLSRRTCSVGMVMQDPRA